MQNVTDDDEISFLDWQDDLTVSSIIWDC